MRRGLSIASRAAIACHMALASLNVRRADHFPASQGFDETVNPMTAGSFCPSTAWPRSPPETAPRKQDKWSRSERNGLEHGVHLPEAAAWRSSAAVATAMDSAVHSSF